MAKNTRQALLPCGRATAGAKFFAPPPLLNMRQMTMVVDGGSGRRRFVEIGRFTAESKNAEAALAQAGLT
jgi:hypothetical protein